MLVCVAFGANADEKADAVRRLIPWILDEGESLRGIRFADVIAATSGKRVIPIDRADKDDQRVRLKAEFEGSNADLYRKDAVVGSSAK